MTRLDYAKQKNPELAEEMTDDVFMDIECAAGYLSDIDIDCDGDCSSCWTAEVDNLPSNNPSKCGTEPGN